MAIITLIDTMLSLILSPQVIDAHIRTCLYTTRVHTQKQHTRLYTYVNTHVLTNAKRTYLPKPDPPAKQSIFVFVASSYTLMHVSFPPVEN